MSKYFAYKALNAIVKSKSQLEDCGCEHAMELIDESSVNLTNATRATSLPSVKILLKRLWTMLWEVWKPCTNTTPMIVDTIMMFWP